MGLNKTFLICYITLITISLFFPACGFGQSKKTENFTFTIEFYPSFINDSKLIVSKIGNNKFVEIIEIRATGTFSEKPNDNKLHGFTKISKKELLRNDFVSKKYFSDTIYLKVLESVHFSDKILDSLFLNLNDYQLHKQKSLKIPQGIIVGDGIDIFLEYKTKKRTNKFHFEYIRREHLDEINMLRLIFQIAEKSFKKDETFDYIEKLQNYMRFGLITRVINKKPLEISAYGYYNDDFSLGEKFLNTLPKNEPIILDIRNLRGTYLIEVFKSYFNKNDDLNIYWLIDDNWEYRRIRYGHDFMKAYLDRDELLKDLKLEN